MKPSIPRCWPLSKMGRSPRNELTSLSTGSFAGKPSWGFWGRRKKGERRNDRSRIPRNDRDFSAKEQNCEGMFPLKLTAGSFGEEEMAQCLEEGRIALMAEEASLAVGRRLAGERGLGQPWWTGWSRFARPVGASLCIWVRMTNFAALFPLLDRL